MALDVVKARAASVPAHAAAARRCFIVSSPHEKRQGIGAVAPPSLPQEEVSCPRVAASLLACKVL
jgi:hypothetical protein